MTRRSARFGGFLVAVLTLFGAASAPAQEPAAEDRVVLLDGAAAQGVIDAITEAGAITGTGLPEGLTINNLRRIDRPAPAETKFADPAVMVDLVGGGRLGLTKFSVDDQQKCHLRHALLGELVLPIETVKSVRFMTAGEPDSTFVAAQAEKRDEDRIFVKLDASLQPIKGLIESIDEFNVEFDPGSGVRKVARDRVYGIVMAQVGRPPDRSGECLVTLHDGSSIWGKVTSLADKKLAFRVNGRADASAPWDTVKSLGVRSNRMMFLSDAEPVEARHQPIVTLQRPWQPDRSVGGRPLTLGGKVFEKGLGVASRSVLVFNNEGNFDLLAATIGIDGETEGRGDCIFVVEADGREVFRQRMTGKDQPQAISVDITGKERISLLVEPGEDLDLADHADWGDARLVRK